MTISEEVIRNILNNGFNVSHTYKWYSEVPHTVENTVISKSIVANISSREKTFIPTMLLKRVVEYIDTINTLDNPIDITFVKSLIVKCKHSYKTSSSAIKTLLNLHPDVEVMKVHLKDHNYIGGTGLIMREDFTPIIIWGYNIGYDNSLRRYRIGEPTIYIHNSIFTDTDPISKYIKSTILPFLATHNTYMLPYSGSTISNQEFTYYGYNIRVVIEDCSHMIYTVKEPDVKDLINLPDKLAQMVEENNNQSTDTL